MSDELATATRANAERRFERIRLTAQSARERLEHLRDLVEEAKTENDHETLGYASWTDYLSDALGAEPMRLSRDQRQELVGYLAQEGMPNRAIAPIVGVDRRTVDRDFDQLGQMSQLDDLPEKFTGRDGRDRARPTPRPDPAPIDPFVNWSEEEHLLRKRLLDGETVVINMRAGGHGNLQQWADGIGLFVRVDRRTEWGNPFEIPDDGDREAVITKYAQHYLPHKDTLRNRIPDLRGKALGCWCAPEPCHGDVLKAKADR